MKTYQDFEIILTDTDIDLPSLLADACSSPWQFDAEGTKECHEMSASDSFRFTSVGDTGSQPAWLVVVRRSIDTFYIANLGPAEFGRFTHDEYNAVLQSFLDNVVVRIPDYENLITILSADQIDLSVTLGDKAFGLLKSFSSCANRNALHPNDRDRFYDFIGCLHRESIELDEVTFKRWLTEEGGWSDDQASDVQRDYSVCRELLNRYDNKG